MDDQEKQSYLEKYHKAKQEGLPFFPDILFKDAVVSLVVFLVLVSLAFFLGAPLEARADPADTSYTPRPEWYFLFLFQLLKYFPGKLEVLGVVVLPTIAILLLLALPFLDRSPRRHPLARPFVTGVTSFVLLGVIFLTVQSYREAPPPAQAASGDKTAELYAQNCASCHGPSVEVKEGDNLYEIIAQGRHPGMPAWSADLTTDQIDALVGFILSPGGSKLFSDNCGTCHEATELAAGDPLTLKEALEEGQNFPPHTGVEQARWKETLTQEERTALLNFLVAPDGQRLFAINCAPCHGRAVPFSGQESELRQIISKGGMHLEMPPWRAKLSDAELETLAQYVVEPTSAPSGSALFQKYCSTCHGERIPKSPDIDHARQTIASGGPHETMPVWGDILTPEQLNALVSYTLSAAKGTSLEVGQDLFLTNCSPCHGEFGEGGPNPARPGDVIAPISTADYLKTRDDFTIRSIITQGQPNLGMSPFGSSYGGPLDDEDIDAIVAYIRSWEAKPPVEVPPELAAPTQAVLSGAEIYANLCSQCHGRSGEGGIGPALAAADFQSQNTDQDIYNTIDKGHKATSMIAWGEILTQDQIRQLVELIRKMKPIGTSATPTAPSTAPTFVKDIQPIFNVKCTICHGAFGGWDATSYEKVMTTGTHAPVIIPGNVEASLLAHKLLGTQTEGTVMPPAGKLPDEEIQVILDWIAAGAPQK